MSSQSAVRRFALPLVLALAAALAVAAGDPPRRALWADENADRPRTIAEVQPGDRVTLEGEVIRVIDRAEFRLSDESGSIPVRLAWERATVVSVGDRVAVEGIVEDAGAFGLPRPEVRAETLRLSSGATIAFDRADAERNEPRAGRADGVTPVGRLTRGQRATIRGEIVRLIDHDEFRLADDSGSVRVYIGWRNQLRAQVGDVVTVTGLVDDDPWPMPLEVYASSITTATGERVDLTGGETLETPVSSPEAAMPIRRPTAPTAIAALRPHETALIEGVVDRVLDEDEFRLRDDSGSIRVYVGWRNRVPAAPGDRVTVLGVVDADGPGGLFREVYASEITLPGGRVVRLQSAMSSPAEEPAVERLRAEAVGTVIPISQVRRGQRVTLAGVVDRIRDSDEFILRDDTGRIEIYIGWRNAMPVSMGERVTVFGVADDDVFPGRRPDVYADRILREDGSLVTFDRRDE